VTPKPRPRLSSRCLARLHFASGTCRIALSDAETGETAEVGPREWTVLSCLDGTRDIDGIVLAASREGVLVTAEEVAALVASLEEEAMIEQGPFTRAPRALVPPPATTRHGERPIEVLPGYRFRCNGQGSCCRLYSSIVFSPLEAARARSLLPRVLDAGERHEHAFTPERGAGPCPGSAVALVEGSCAYLDGSVCGLHRAGGPDSKPFGCNLFPLTLVDDGKRARVSVAVECRCVLESLDASDGDPLLSESVCTVDDLDSRYRVEVLPDRVSMTAERDAPLEEFVDWSDAVLDVLASRNDFDAAAVAWSLAAAVDAHGLDRDVSLSAMEAHLDLPGSAPAECVASLGARAARRAKGESAFRSARDLTRKGMLGIAASAEILADREILAAVLGGAGARPGDERFYLRAVLFGHQLVGSPISDGLRGRAVAMWIARVFPLATGALFPGDSDGAFERPLALVEAILRGHGMRA